MYSSEQIKNIKIIINSYFENKELQSKIKQKIKEENIKSIDDLNTDQLISLLKDIDLLDNILIDLSKLEEINEHNNKLSDGRTDVSLGTIKKRAMALKLIQGQAFVDYLVKKNEHTNQYFQISLSFQNQRFNSNKIPVSAEPQFNETFIFDLQIDERKKNIDLLMLSKLDCQVELAVLLIDDFKQTKEIYSIKQIEWRYILSFGLINLNIELVAYELAAKLIPQKDSSSKPSVGVLQVHLDLLPKGEKQLIPEKLLNEQLLKEKKYRDLEIMQFYEYSQEWWSDYKSLNQNFDQRPCKIYAENEDGIYLPVTSYVRPLWGLQGIDSPYHASRFVSLIPLSRSETPGGEKIECWQRFHTLLSRGKGDFESHALLLCSLLIGFGMDAYVVVGTSGEGPHLWVLTRAKNESKKWKFMFWESLTGQRYDQKDPRVNSLYRKIGCLFNNNSFYANIQNEERAFHVDLNFEDQTKWKSMEKEQIEKMQCYQPEIALTLSTMNYMEQEKIIESNLKYFITEYRKSESLLTRFDDKLSHLLMPSLANYEFERITGKNFGIEEFQQAIKSYVPLQYTFKAFPIQFLHRNTEQMFLILKNAPICSDILLTRGDKINFGIKAKVCLYPNDFFAVWITIAVSYISLD